MRLEELERELLQERPEIDPDFATRLDEWAARGFPRGGELDVRREGRGRGALAWVRRRGTVSSRARRRGMRRVVAPAFAAATILIIGGTIVVTQVENASLTSGGEFVGLGGDEDHADDGDSEAEAQVESATAEQQATEEIAPAIADQARRRNFVDGDPGPNRRRQAQTVSVELATPPADFRESADGVLGVVADHNGFVMNSNVSSGDPNVSGADLGRARFDLRIPAAQLQPALAALSDLGHVVSRTDGTRDITARFNSARDRIETFTEARDRLLRQLEEAVTETEQQSIRRRLRIVENQLENARADLARAQQRVRVVPVAVTIRADESIEKASAAWGIGDAWDSARDVLRVALGVALIAAAVILPLAVIALIAFLAWRLAARIGRERALDEL